MNHSTEFQALPRINMYFADGKGRDSYIYSNNGGYWKNTFNGSINTIEPNLSSPHAKMYNLR